MLLGHEISEAAIRVALATGSKEVHRARLNFYGYQEAGKSSLFKRILGQPYDPNIARTEGIAIQAVKVDGNAWKEKTIKADNMNKAFSKGVAEQGLSKESPAEHKQNKSHKSKFGNEEATRQSPEKRRQKNENPKASPMEEAKEGEETIPVADKAVLEEVNKSLKSDIEELDYIIFAWDFGGQAEYYATHHLFLAGEAAHLIVMDITKDFRRPLDHENAKMMQSTPTTPADFLCYWLNSIYTESTKNRLPKPKVAIFLTHIDKIEEKYIPKDYIKDYKQDILNLIKGKPYEACVSLKKIFAVDNTSKVDDHFDEAKQEIRKMVTKQSSWGQPRPLSWLKLEADIRKERDDQSNHVKHLKVSKICEMALQYGMKEADVNKFLSFHDAMGEFIYPQNTDMDGLVIVDAGWLVEKLKALISPLEFLPENIQGYLRNGKILKSNLHKVWKGQDQKTVDFLINLMEKFDLLIPFSVLTKDESEASASELDDNVEDSWFLIPSVLPPLTQSDYEKKHKEMTKVYTATHKATQPLQVATFHKLISKCSKKGWKICPIRNLKNTGVYFDIHNKLRLSVMKLSYLESFTVETSIWLKKSKELKKNTIIKIFGIKQQVEAELEALQIEPANEFKLCCPNCTCHGDDNHLVDVLVYKHSKRRDTLLKSHEDRCEKAKAPWNVSKYRGTGFGKYINFPSHCVVAYNRCTQYDTQLYPV